MSAVVSVSSDTSSVSVISPVSGSVAVSAVVSAFSDRLVRLSEVYGYDEDVYGELEIVGWNYDVDIEKVLSHRDKYRDLLLALDSDDFELKREYRFMLNYMQELIDKHESTSDDLFAMLTD